MHCSSSANIFVVKNLCFILFCWVFATFAEVAWHPVISCRKMKQRRLHWILCQYCNMGLVFRSWDVNCCSRAEQNYQLRLSLNTISPETSQTQTLTTGTMLENKFYSQICCIAPAGQEYCCQRQPNKIYKKIIPVICGHHLIKKKHLKICVTDHATEYQSTASCHMIGDLGFQKCCFYSDSGVVIIVMLAGCVTWTGADHQLSAECLPRSG